MACSRCGADIKWAEVDGERIPLDTIPTTRQPRSDQALYRLDAENHGLAEVIDRAGVPGYPDHRETCSVGLRERERL